VVVIGGDRERRGLVIATASTHTFTTTSAAASAAVARLRLTTAAATPSTAVLRRLGHRTARMTVYETYARTHSRLFHFLLFLDPQENGLPEETAFFGLCRCGRFVCWLF